MIRFLLLIEKDERIVVKNLNVPIFKDELSFFLMVFQDNNDKKLEKLLVFKKIL